MEKKRLNQKRIRRAKRVRASLRSSVSPRMRVSVFRSLNGIYAQLIDDVNHKTIASSSSISIASDKKTEKLDKTAIAKLVGVELAKKALDAQVDKANFDRGRFLYHGRVRALADGLREGGLGI